MLNIQVYLCIWENQIMDGLKIEDFKKKFSLTVEEIK
mgnify:CR=1 FL=1